MKKDDDGFAWLLVFALLAVTLIAALALIAFVASFLVPVEPSIAVFAVLTGLVIAFRLFLSPAMNLLPDSDKGTLAVELVAGAAWITGVFALSTVLGPGPIFIGAVLAALVISCLVLDTAGTRAGAKGDAANRAAHHAKVLRGWEDNLADDPELAERLRAEGWRADGPIEESRTTYLRVWEALKTVRREEGRPVWPKPKQVNLVETAMATEGVPGEPDAGSAPRDPQDP